MPALPRIAAVRRQGGKTVCAACGKPRAGDVVLGTSGRSPRTDVMLERAGARARRGFGALSIALGIGGAALSALLIPGTAGFVVAGLVGLVAVGVGGLALRSGAQRAAAADAREDDARADKLRSLARDEGGRLTAETAAEALSITVDEADAALTALVGDGSEVDVDVTEDGVVEYVFRDARGPRVRVAVAEESDASEVEGSQPSNERRRRRRSRDGANGNSERVDTKYSRRDHRGGASWMGRWPTNRA